jgi:hypothetical protein
MQQPRRQWRQDSMRNIAYQSKSGIVDMLDGEDVVPGFSYPVAALFR